MDPFILVCGILFFGLIIIIGIVSYKHVHNTPFKPKFVISGDNNIQMEFYNFGGIQTERTKRFYSQYTVGMEVQYQNRKYKITGFKELKDSSTIRVDKKIVAYLEEIN
jgi:hypothetical protein